MNNITIQKKYMNLYTKKALGGLLVGLATTGLKHLCTNNKSPIATGKNLKENFLNRDTFNIVASTIPLMLIKSTPIGLFGSIGLSVLMNCINKPSNNDTNDGNTNNLETKHASIISTIKTYANQWTDNKDADGKNARFGGKNFWDNNQELLEKMGLEAKDFYADYNIPDGACPEEFHDIVKDSPKEDQENLFDAIAGCNEEVKALYDKLKKLNLPKYKQNPHHLKEEIVYGVVCKFTLEDIEEFCTKNENDSFRMPDQYPENIKIMNGFDDDKRDNILSQAKWGNNTCLGQHNWSPCDHVVGKIEAYLEKNGNSTK
jgi:hypothetical protein